MDRSISILSYLDLLSQPIYSLVPTVSIKDICLPYGEFIHLCIVDGYAFFTPLVGCTKGTVQIDCIITGVGNIVHS